MKKYLVILTLVILGALAAFGFQGDKSTDVAAALVADAPVLSGFERVNGPLPFDEKVDQGPHPDYQTEWWYYTGNLTAADNAHYGFQLTFFRRALVPAEMRTPNRASNWAFDQVYLVHFALTDVENEQFYFFEQYSRGAAGLAGAKSDPYRVWLDNFVVEAVSGGEGVYRLTAQNPQVALQLVLEDQKGSILQGNNGYSQKGPDRGNASFYASQTRLKAAGTVEVMGEQVDVAGTAWMDHEFSTSALTEGQIGWDWFSIQLDDNTELMLFYIRRDDGSVDPYSSGTIIYSDGSTRHLSQDAFKIEVQDTWRSPHTKANYPAQWRIEVPEEQISLIIKPHLDDQELRLSYAYWEGAVRVSGMHAGKAVDGNGYVEMTGYAAAFNLDF